MAVVNTLVDRWIRGLGYVSSDEASSLRVDRDAAASKLIQLADDYKGARHDAGCLKAKVAALEEELHRIKYENMGRSWKAKALSDSLESLKPAYEAFSQAYNKFVVSTGASDQNAEPNPWKVGYTNVTRQVYICAKYPELAEKMKEEAKLFNEKYKV